VALRFSANGNHSTPKELAKRTAIFTIAGQVGTMFAGAMMAAIERTMSGHSGLKGWQWVFLIDGIITCPIAVFGYLYFPDTPERTRASYLSKRERQIALSRVPPKRADSNSIALLPLFKRVCCTPAL
jgi:ACS family pantothenate transporter-like MFS transporter